MISENILAKVEFILPKEGTMELPELEYFHQLLNNTVSFWNKDKTVCEIAIPCFGVGKNPRFLCY